MRNLLNPAERAFLALLLGAICVSGCAGIVSGPHVKELKRPATIFMIGDSTMADKPLIPAYPERGWGQMLPMYFTAEVRVENHAMNGRSSKSFLAEGRWE